MKKVVMLLLLVLSVSFASAELACNPEITILSQDPYPAVPGEYVKLVFQMTGIDSVNCNDITFNLLENYPIEFDPGETGLKIFNKVDYIKDYGSSLLIPYEVRINENALNGANSIDIRVQSKGESAFTKTLDVEVSDVRADFEVYVKDYSYTTNEITLEILNIESSDVEALTVEIPKQDSINVKGANRIVVGDLDSNEYTTADFEASPSDGEFKINLIYSDTINTRRTMEKTVSFDSSYFTNRKADMKTTSRTTYIIWAVIVVLLLWWIIKKFTKKKKK